MPHAAGYSGGPFWGLVREMGLARTSWSNRQEKTWLYSLILHDHRRHGPVKGMNETDISEYFIMWRRLAAAWTEGCFDMS